MKKEILELVVLGLQTKELFSTENIVNALASLPEEQQHQWIETMLPNNQTKSEVESDANTPTTTYVVLQVTTHSGTSRTNVVFYLKNALNFTIAEARKLVFGNDSTFELKVSAHNSAKIIENLELLHCTVTQK